MKENKTLKLRGLSRFQTCILTRIDENNNIFLELNGFGKMSKEGSIEKLQQNITNSILIFSDKEATYKTFAVFQSKHFLGRLLIKSTTFWISSSDILLKSVF